MNKPYNIQNTNICNGIFHISFFKALLISEGEPTQGERESGRTGIGTNRIWGETTRIPQNEDKRKKLKERDVKKHIFCIICV